MAGAMTPQYIPMFSSIFHIHHKANETGHRKVVFLAGRAQRDRREMISREIFSVANMASGVFFVVASFPDFFSQIESHQCPRPPTLYFCAYYQCFLSLFAVMCLPCLHDA